MHIVIPHVGKSHLTRECLASIPDSHRVVLVDASYVADLDVYARHRSFIDYVRPEEPLGCLAHNWNLGASHVPESEHVWLFCASDVQFYAESWVRLERLLKLYPDAGIVRDEKTQWNVWAVRRWAWDLLKPMDERYKPCGGEDDDLVMKCRHAGIKIRAGWIGVCHLEGGHATRIDIKRDEANTTWDFRRNNIAVFKRKWGCTPSIGRDAAYKAAHHEVHIHERRAEQPVAFSVPVERDPWPERKWPSPLRLNIGCGTKPMDGYVNTDADPKNNHADVIFDAARDVWPFEDGSIERLAAFHVLEHMNQVDGLAFLTKAQDALAEGGTLTIECPDLSGVCAGFSRDEGAMVRSLYGQQTSSWRTHRWGYSQSSIRNVLHDVGFVDVEVGPGTDYHAKEEPCLRATARKGDGT